MEKETDVEIVRRCIAHLDFGAVDSRGTAYVREAFDRILAELEAQKKTTQHWYDVGHEYMLKNAATDSPDYEDLTQPYAQTARNGLWMAESSVASMEGLIAELVARLEEQTEGDSVEATDELGLEEHTA